LIEVTDICKSFGGKPVLKNITFTAGERDFICIVGRNGCGKSTLLNILSGMLKADSGAVTVAEGKTTGFTPQADVLFNDLSVNDNLKFWAGASGLKASAIWENECVKVLEIEDMKKKKVKILSGGMKRRVSIAVSVLKNPDIVILDEPFSALDIFYKKSLTDYLKNLNGMGKTIIYTSHSTDEIIGLCSKVLLIENGEITDRTGEYEK
jgi:ABC-2 type transport system ATP-binding protein